MLIASSKVYWYASRSSGLVLWVLCAFAVMWGFAVSSRLIRRKGLPAWMLSLHRHLGTLALVFTAIHLVSLWADEYVAFGPKELFVPMASTWRPGAVAWGIVATYCLVVVQVTSWLQRRMPRRVWHALHLFSIPVLVAGTAHGILAGADWPNRIVQWMLLVFATGVVWLASFRLLASRGDPGRAAQLQKMREAAAAARATATEEATWGPPVPAERRLLLLSGAGEER